MCPCPLPGLGVPELWGWQGPAPGTSLPADPGERELSGLSDPPQTIPCPFPVLPMEQGAAPARSRFPREPPVTRRCHRAPSPQGSSSWHSPVPGPPPALGTGRIFPLDAPAPGWVSLHSLELLGGLFGAPIVPKGAAAPSSGWGRCCHLTGAMAPSLPRSPWQSPRRALGSAGASPQPQIRLQADFLLPGLRIPGQIPSSVIPFPSPAGRGRCCPLTGAMALQRARPGPPWQRPRSVLGSAGASPQPHFQPGPAPRGGKELESGIPAAPGVPWGDGEAAPRYPGALSAPHLAPAVLLQRLSNSCRSRDAPQAAEHIPIQVLIAWDRSRDGSDLSSLLHQHFCLAGSGIHLGNIPWEGVKIFPCWSPGWVFPTHICRVGRRFPSFIP